MATFITQPNADLLNDTTVSARPLLPPQLKVYIVIGSITYEFDQIEGVYVEREAAEARVKAVKKIKSEITKTKKYDRVWIEEHDAQGAKGWV